MIRGGRLPKKNGSPAKNRKGGLWQGIRDLSQIEPRPRQRRSGIVRWMASPDSAAQPAGAEEEETSWELPDLPVEAATATASARKGPAGDRGEVRWRPTIAAEPATLKRRIDSVDAVAGPPEQRPHGNP